MHTSSGRWLYGLLLALTTAILWGFLPITMKEVLKVMDPLTATWYRFTVSGSILLTYLVCKRRLPNFKVLSIKCYILLVMALMGLLGNYVLYHLGLNLLSAGTTQLMIQVGPIILIITSVIIFKESFTAIQMIALLILAFGFILFFNDHLGELLTSLTNYTKGIIILVIGSAVWVVYALCQKQLLVNWHSMQIMLFIYLGSSFLLFPWVQPSQVTQLTTLQFWLLVFACLNTLVAYGAFAEALAHWEASKVTAILAITPLITFASVAIAATLWPHFTKAETINLLAYFGAIMVVIGSALIALSPIIITKIKQRRSLKYSQSF